jgi:uncharacterized membrane protein HdeD (DUF308 family)
MRDVICTFRRRNTMIHPVVAQAAQRNWRMLALRGILAVLFGLIALLFPGIALLAFIYVFGVYALIDGIIAVVVSLRERDSLSRWGWLLFEGILSIIAGLVAFALPGLTALVLLYLVAAWAIATGVLEIVAALVIRMFEAREWLLMLAGILSVGFGILLIKYPGAGLLSLLWLVGIYAIVFGILFIIRAFQLRSWVLSGAPQAI